jgi:hypothetical protein
MISAKTGKPLDPRRALAEARKKQRVSMPEDPPETAVEAENLTYNSMSEMASGHLQHTVVMERAPLDAEGDLDTASAAPPVDERGKRRRST